MKKYSFLLLMVFVKFIGFSQTDTIFSNNQKISCVIKEITPDAVKYSLLGEDLMNSIYKNSVQKIVFKNGRVQVFSEQTSFKTIASVDDFDNITIATTEDEVKGLFKLGDLSAKAKGTTTLSNQDRVKKRAYRKLKIVAAMMGGNIIYITDQRSQGNNIVSFGYYSSGTSAETNLSGVAYTNQLPSYDDFMNLINTKRSFTAVEQAKLWSSDTDMIKSKLSNPFTINSISNDNGIIKIEGLLEDEKKVTSFRVVSFNNESFNVFYETKSTSYNIKISL